MIVPPFATLFPNSPWQCTCDLAPVLSSEIFYHRPEDVIFLSCPWTFRNKWLILEFKPSVEALDLRPPRHALTDLIPPLISEFFNKRHQLVILLLHEIDKVLPQLETMTSSLSLRLHLRLVNSCQTHHSKANFLLKPCLLMLLVMTF